jgi:hypothetical protein
VDVGPGPGPAAKENQSAGSAQPFDEKREGENEETPFDRQRKAGESQDSAYNSARRDRDADFYDPYDEERESEPPRTWWQKFLNRLREIIGFEMN